MKPNWHYVEQGSDEWKKLRAGKVTWSNLGKVMAKGAGVTRRNYLYEVMAEQDSGIPAPEGFKSQAVKNGTEREPEGRRLYEEQMDVVVDQVGFINHPNIPYFGGSPDGIMVSLRGGIEIKSPELPTFSERVDGAPIPKDYNLQCHGFMETEALEWVDWVNYFPGYPLLIQRIYRDQKLINEIIAEVRLFNEEVEEKRYKLKNAQYIRIGRPT
jgi:YqaJ-like viral recombinase domain